MTAPLRTPVIARHCAEKLLHMALSNQGDPLGYRAFGGIVEDADCETDQVTTPGPEGPGFSLDR